MHVTKTDFLFSNLSDAKLDAQDIGDLSQLSNLI